MLACRTCRVVLSALEGCAICNPLRRNLVAVDENEDDRPSLATVNHEAIRGLRGQVQYYSGVLATNPGNGQALDKLVKASNSLTKLTDVTRKLQDDGTKAIAAMSFQERAALFIEWYGALPPAYRTLVREQQAEHEVRIAAPVAESAVLS